RDRRHLLLDRNLHELVDIASAVEQRIVGMAMKVDERHLGPALSGGGEHKIFVVGTGRFELPTCRLGGDRSIHLSYVPAVPASLAGENSGRIPDRSSKSAFSTMHRDSA